MTAAAATPAGPTISAPEPELVWEDEGGRLRPSQGRRPTAGATMPRRAPAAVAAHTPHRAHPPDTPVTMSTAARLALSPELPPPDPQLFRLADALLAARRQYAVAMGRDGRHDPADLRRARRLYALAALRYCAALRAHGLEPPAGLPDTAGWLATGGDPAPEGVSRG